MEEAETAGIGSALFIVSRYARSILDHFDISAALEHVLDERGDVEMLRAIRSAAGMSLAYVVRPATLSFGEQLCVASNLLEGEFFAVQLPEYVAPHKTWLAPMLGSLPAVAAPIIGTVRGPPEIGDWTIRAEPDPVPNHPRLHRIVAVNRFPPTSPGTLNLRMVGRFVFPPGRLNGLSDQAALDVGSIVAALAGEDAAYAYVFSEPPLEVRSAIGWLMALVKHSLEEEPGGEAATFIRALARGG